MWENDGSHLACWPFWMLNASVAKRRSLQPCWLPPEISVRLNRLQFEEGATYYHVRVAAFAAFLARLRGDSRIVLGTPGTFRNRVEWHGRVPPRVNMHNKLAVVNCPG
jgi:hypothetical protein